MKTTSRRGMLTASGTIAGLFMTGSLMAGCLGTTPESEDAIDENASALSSVATHGRLRVSGTHIVDANGSNVQLKGMSMFWSQWSGQFWNAGVVNTLANNWGATVVRAAMGVEEGGYLTNPGAEKARVKTLVDAATKAGIYVIIDWHDHNATSHTQQAKDFFGEMARTYGKQSNVIFEIYNEPAGPTWQQVKGYAEQVIGSIRSNGSDNLVIVGTPTWSQDVDAAANDPITSFKNVAYTLHFYAASHKQSLRDKASYAMNKGLALFVTEWGTCDASGNGGLDLNESQTWLNFLDQNGISWANWSLFDKPEAASALKPGASTTGGWPASALSASGSWVKGKMGGAPPPPPPTDGFYKITAVHSGKALDVSGGGRDNGTPIVQWDYWGGDNQKWRITPVGDGSSRISVKSTGKDLDVSGVSKENGAKVHEWDDVGGANQHWDIQSTGSGTFKIIARHSGRALDVGGKDNGALLQQWDYYGGTNQQFHIDRVE